MSSHEITARKHTNRTTGKVVWYAQCGSEVGPSCDTKAEALAAWKAAQEPTVAAEQAEVSDGVKAAWDAYNEARIDPNRSDREVHSLHRKWKMAKRQAGAMTEFERMVAVSRAANARVFGGV